jgi:flagellar hook-associated protein 1 FlgK
VSGLFGVLGVASGGLAVAQRNLAVTSHNIANESTPGYSRQRLLTQAASAVLTGEGYLGRGVEGLTIERFHDAFVERRLVAERSALGSSETQTDVLDQVEELFNEQQSGSGLSSLIGQFFDSFSDLASAGTPGAPVEREAVRAAGQSLIDGLQSADDALRALQRSVNQDVVAGVAEINDILEHIAELNSQIVQDETAAPANDLRDSRDRLVRELSDLVGVTTFENERGAATVLLGGGITLVNGGTAFRLGTAVDPTNPFDPGFARIVVDPGGMDLDVTADIGSGRIGGLLRSRDTILPSAIRSLDTLAFNVADRVNTLHAAGVGLDGSVGNFFLALPAVEDAARDLELDPAIAASADAIAAGQTSDPGDNRNALDLAALRETAQAFFLPGDPIGVPSGPVRSVLDHMAAVVADVGQQSQLAQSGRAQRERTVELIENRRDEVSGVSIDEEVTQLVRLQAVYQANARVVNTVNELLESLISLV